MAEGLARYDAACRAVSAALAFDEVKDLRDRADALRLYARQARDRTLEVEASEIRIRAERRLGELMALERASGRLRPGAPGRTETRAAGTDCGVGDRVTLAEFGIDERLGDRARRYAEISAAEFAARLAKRRAALARDSGRVGVSLFDADERTAIKAARRAEREVELGARQTALPQRRYGVILADPEWRFEPWSRDSGLNRSADNHYPTSPLGAIQDRNVAAIAADDCVLFLWATVPMLVEGLAVVAAWGFRYVSHFAWGKDRVGTGYWNRNRHELLLVGTRGAPPAPAPGTQWDSLLEAPVAAHSAKPERFLELIEAYFPTLPKIELNRRGAARPGWDAWGNEAGEAA